METRIINEILDAVYNWEKLYDESPRTIECSPGAIQKLIKEVHEKNIRIFEPVNKSLHYDDAIGILYGIPVIIDNKLSGDTVLLTSNFRDRMRSHYDTIFDIPLDTFKHTYLCTPFDIAKNIEPKEISNDSFINILNGGDHKVTS